MTERELRVKLNSLNEFIAFKVKHRYDDNQLRIWHLDLIIDNLIQHLESYLDFEENYNWMEEA